MNKYLAFNELDGSWCIGDFERVKNFIIHENTDPEHDVILVKIEKRLQFRTGLEILDEDKK